jgi:hypothetical protein
MKGREHLENLGIDGGQRQIRCLSVTTLNIVGSGQGPIIWQKYVWPTELTTAQDMIESGLLWTS